MMGFKCGVALFPASTQLHKFAGVSRGLSVADFLTRREP